MLLGEFLRSRSVVVAWFVGDDMVLCVELDGERLFGEGDVDELIRKMILELKVMIIGFKAIIFLVFFNNIKPQEKVC